MADNRPNSSAVGISHIAGNAPDDVKSFLENLLTSPRTGRSPTFAESIERRLKVTEVSIQKKSEEERKTEARVVLELEVSEGMSRPGSLLVLQSFVSDCVFWKNRHA